MRAILPPRASCVSPTQWPLVTLSANHINPILVLSLLYKSFECFCRYPANEMGRVEDDHRTNPQAIFKRHGLNFWPLSPPQTLSGSFLSLSLSLSLTLCSHFTKCSIRDRTWALHQKKKKRKLKWMKPLSANIAIIGQFNSGRGTCARSLTSGSPATSQGCPSSPLETCSNNKSSLG